MTFNPKTLQNKWSNQAANAWTKLPTPKLKADMSAANDHLFRLITRATDPETLSGQMLFNGTLYKIQDRFAPPYYCGFVWSAADCGMICSVQIPLKRFYTEWVYEGPNPPAQYVVLHA